jgi:pyruvate/2-oxoglutarate dehydrogenase complex dihydrolipoamide acyltransferase (E2) component
MPGISKSLPANQRNIPDHKINLPEQELNKIAGIKSVRKGRELTIKEKIEIMELEQLERSVREHERAHLRTARNLAVSQPTFEYKEGPDGKKYAVHGEVKIDSAVAGGDAEEAIEKALKMQRTALAPSDPSSKDLQVAARARIIESKAHRKLAREKQFENNNIQSPGLNAYQTTRDFQENLYKILELFA